MAGAEPLALRPPTNSLVDAPISPPPPSAQENGFASRETAGPIPSEPRQKSLVAREGATTRRRKLEIKIDRAGQPGPDGLVTQLELARQTEAKACWLARDVRTLVQWLSHDVQALAGPALATRQILFDFIVAELARREPEDARRIRPMRIALQNQRDDLLAFAGVLDDKLIAVARAQKLSVSLVREACVLHRLPTTSAAYWQGRNHLRTKLGSKFCALFDAVTRVMAQTPRSSSLMENLNSRLRNYFALRRHLGWIVFGPAAVLLEPPSFHTQPTRRANWA